MKKLWKDVKAGEKVFIEGIPKIYIKLTESLSFTKKWPGHDSKNLNAVETSNGEPCNIPDTREVEVVEL